MSSRQKITIKWHVCSGSPPHFILTSPWHIRVRRGKRGFGGTQEWEINAIRPNTSRINKWRRKKKTASPIFLPFPAPPASDDPCFLFLFSRKKKRKVFQLGGLIRNWKLLCPKQQNTFLHGTDLGSFNSTTLIFKVAFFLFYSIELIQLRFELEFKYTIGKNKPSVIN